MFLDVIKVILINCGRYIINSEELLQIEDNIQLYRFQKKLYSL